MKDEQDSDRSEAATPYKLEKAREQGQVPRSMDISSLAILAALALFCHASGPEAARRLANLQARTISAAGRSDWTAEASSRWLSALLADAVWVIAPLLAAAVIAGILVNFLQAGAVFSVKALGPDFARLDPMAGLKRLFSLRLLYEAAKGVVKIAILGAVTYLAVTQEMAEIMRLASIDPKGYAKALLGLASALLVKLSLVVLCVGLLDLAYTRWDFAKRMRMSRRDLRDEAKHREGDPRIRARMRQLRAEMLKRARGLGNVGNADVLITNPTHLAVALAYSQGSTEAPQLLAKGAGEMAALLREAAARHRIPIVENKPLARQLYREVDLEGRIPAKTYAEVAKILVWAFAVRAGVPPPLEARS
jgi:flagellar biosynthesis protein FlhB